MWYVTLIYAHDDDCISYSFDDFKTACIFSLGCSPQFDSFYKEKPRISKTPYGRIK